MEKIIYLGKNLLSFWDKEKLEICTWKNMKDKYFLYNMNYNNYKKEKLSWIKNSYLDIRD